ncbi:cytochrome P450 monooxygenase [Tricladium varicosporioides]|nr:cytochrome P450 monooxygenase [Hymenoscyphus varicosporioides]
MIDTFATILWACLHAFLAVVLLIVGIYYLFLLPPKYPLNIDAVPFWVGIIPFFRDVDQEDTYKKYIEKPLQAHGAVKLFFAGRWNVLVQQSSYVSEIFKDEEVFQKRGNQKKIPHSVIAEFLGDNIISARADDWKLYQGVIKPGLQRNFEADSLVENATLLCNLVKETQKIAGNAGVPISELLQRYTIANVSNTLLQTDFQTLTNPNAPLHKLQSEVKREIFQTIYMNFPILDWLPHRKRAREAIEKFSEELAAGLNRTHEGISCSMSSEKLGSRLIAARDEGILTKRQFRDSLNAAFVAAQENPQLLLTSTLYLLAKYPEVQQRLRGEVCSLNTNLDPATFVLCIQDLPYLTSVIYECLRLFPPISQMINRRTSTDVMLGGKVHIPKHTYVGYIAYSTNRDKRAWGPDADDFQPARWGSTNEDINRTYRKARARAEFISFHGGKRSCLGEKFAMLEMRISLVTLVKSVTWILDEDWPDRKTPSGPLYPRGLRLKFQSV